MTPDQETCDHNWPNWVRSEFWRNRIQIFPGGLSLEYPVKCTKCKLEAKETFTYSGRFTDEGEAV